MREVERNAKATVRTGIVGFGRLAQNYYVPALRRLSGICRVIAVADPSAPCRAAGAKLLPGIALYESQEQMLDAENLDAILVASPPSAHLGALRDASSRPHLAVFLEKPLVPPGQLEYADGMLSTLRERVMVNFNRRSWPRYQAIGKALQDGNIGALESADLELRVNVSKWLAVTQHRIEPGQGGALYDLGSQMIDLASVIVDRRPTRISAQANDPRKAFDVRLTLGFPNSSAAVRCHVAYDGFTRESVSVHGSAGELHMADPNMAMHILTRGARHPTLLGRLRDFATFAHHAACRHTSMSRFTIEATLRTFITCVQTASPFPIGADDAIFNARALEAARRSIESGKPEIISPSTAEVVA